MTGVCLLQGPDARNAILGVIFGYAAFARAGRLQDQQQLIKCVEAVVAAMASKVYLREAAAKVLVFILEGLDEPALAAVLQQCPDLQAMLVAPVQESHPEVCALQGLTVRTILSLGVFVHPYCSGGAGQQ